MLTRKKGYNWFPLLKKNASKAPIPPILYLLTADSVQYMRQMHLTFDSHSSFVRVMFNFHYVAIKMLAAVTKVAKNAIFS